MAGVRSFVAVHLDAETRAALASAAEGLRGPAAAIAASWVTPENFHITLKFLGGVDDTGIPAVIAALQTATRAHAPFTLEVVGLGAFPSATRPRVLWAGVRGGHGALASLAASVDTALSPLGFPREDRDFSAHVTLARVRDPRRAPALAEALAAAATQPFGRVSVRELALMRSDLSPRGARYTSLATAPLAG